MKKILKKVVAKKEKTDAEKERDAQQLRRLQTLLDVIFGALIVLLFTLLPKPIDILQGDSDPLSIFGDGNFIMFLIGIILVTIYWFQSNKTIGNLVATDGKHSFLSIMQMIFLLLYFYSLGLDAVTNSDVLALFMQSVTLAVAGFCSVGAWVYASKHAEIISDAVSDSETRDIQISILTEPLAALFTIPFAFIGPWLWNLSWLSVIVFGWFLKKRNK